MKYGIGITTRNRPDVLISALQQHAKFAPSDALFVIVDDCSDEDTSCDHLIEEFSKTIPNVVFRKSPKRLGIAKAKNACLAVLKDCEHIFLFDDDAWPRCKGWADQWIASTEKHDIGHSMYMATTHPTSSNEALRAHTQRIRTIGGPKDGISVWSNCLGVALYFSNKCLAALGGYDIERAVNVYGYEHAQMSQRACLAGFTKGHPYVSPINVENLIYSIDITYNWHGEHPTFEAKWIGGVFRSSTTAEEAAAHTENAAMMENLTAYIELIDPLAEDN